MNILIYGAGVIGSIFAGNLAYSKNNVTVLARGTRFEEIKKNGIILVNPKTTKRRCISVHVIDTLLPSMEYDYIIVAMQRNQVDEILPVLAANCSKNIVFVVNTAAGYDKWADAVGKGRLMIGFPSAGGERNNGEVNYFIGQGLQRVFQTTTFGEYSGVKTARVQALIKLFNHARIPSVFYSDMDAWQKTHVALVSSIANALYGYECDNFRLGHSYKDIKDMIRGVKEGFQVLRKNGIKPAPEKLCWINLPTPILTLIFCFFMRTTLAETTMAKHCIAARPEMLLLQSEFDKLILKSGMRTPTIEKLRKNLYAAK